MFEQNVIHCQSGGAGGAGYGGGGPGGYGGGGPYGGAPYGGAPYGGSPYGAYPRFVNLFVTCVEPKSILMSSS